MRILVVAAALNLLMAAQVATAQTPEAGVATKTPAKQQLTDTPSNAYLTIHNAELKATSYEELLPLRAKESIARDKPANDAERKMMFTLLKEFMVKDVKVTGERINGSTATVFAVPANAAANEHTTGEIKLIRENGAWKLDSEKWQTKIR